ncbi:polysaccharide biosynthesis tyrosine autokinase [Rubrivivax sp. RP6-9]|uniref:polysaccharide biosynthesis tyrosine autokinase n=1 Tax=Rubrivivax sp. RP6-9 TaxID=3415750 RepID=UPI003CC54C67
MNKPLGLFNAPDLRVQHGDDQPIGMRLVALGHLRADDIPTIADAQRGTRLRFGETAMQLGLVSREDVDAALARQRNVPGMPRWADGSELVVSTHATDPVAESIRTLRAQLALHWMHERQTQCVSIVGAARGEGRSFIAANLAVAFAQLQERTLLIDMDLRHPRQHAIFRVDNSRGLSTLVSGRGNGHEIQRIDGYGSLSLLPAGPRAPHPQELLAARTMGPVLEQARLHHDIVIIDTPAWSTGADAQIVSAQARQALLVSAPGRASRDDVALLVHALRQVGVAIVGAAVNRR